MYRNKSINNDMDQKKESSRSAMTTWTAFPQSIWQRQVSTSCSIDGWLVGSLDGWIGGKKRREKRMPKNPRSKTRYYIINLATAG